MFDTDKFTDYKDISGISCIYATCLCDGRIEEGELPCSRNPDAIKKRDSTVCLWFLSNGSFHCGHRTQPDKMDKP